MASTPIFKTLSMADAYLSSTLLPTTLKTSTYPFLSLPSKPIKFLHLSSSASPPSPSPSWVSLKRKPFSSTLVPLVASTSDWAQQEEENQLQQQGEEDEGEEEFKWENEEREEDGAEARLSDWEGEGEEEQMEGSEGSGGEDGLLEEGGEVVEEGFPELSEDAKLFVGNLPYDVDSEQLAQLFDQAGVVEVAEVIYNRQTDQSRGFGFVTMSSVEEAEKAVEMYHRFDMNGRLLTVNKAAPRGARPERTTTSRPFRIYVGNLPWQVDNARLEQLFSEHGKVLEAKVVYDQETGRSRGFGFVAMSSQTEMDDAIAALDGQSLDGRALRVNVAEERPRRGSF